MKGEESNEMKKEKVGKGMYHAIDLDEWDDPFPILTIGNKGRVHLVKIRPLRD